MATELYGHVADTADLPPGVNLYSACRIRELDSSSSKLAPAARGIHSPDPNEMQRRILFEWMSEVWHGRLGTSYISHPECAPLFPAPQVCLERQMPMSGLFRALSLGSHWFRLRHYAKEDFQLVGTACVLVAQVLCKQISEPDTEASVLLAYYTQGKEGIRSTCYLPHVHLHLCVLLRRSTRGRVSVSFRAHGETRRFYGPAAAFAGACSGQQVLSLAQVMLAEMPDDIRDSPTFSAFLNILLAHCYNQGFMSRSSPGDQGAAELAYYLGCCAQVPVESDHGDQPLLACAALHAARRWMGLPALPDEAWRLLSRHVDHVAAASTYVTDLESRLGVASLRDMWAQERIRDKICGDQEGCPWLKAALLVLHLPMSEHPLGPSDEEAAPAASHQPAEEA